MSDDVFGKAAGAQATVNGVNINPGKYVFEIQRLEAGKKTTGNFFIAELQVLEASQTDPNKVPNAVGTRCSYVVNLDKIAGPGSMKGFFLSLFGETDQSISQEDLKAAMKQACSAEQPFAFFKLRDEAFEKPQKADKTKNFTHHRWVAIEPDEAELADIKARQAAIKPA